MIENEVFTVRREWLELFDGLEVAEQSEFYYYLLQYGFYGREPCFQVSSLKSVAWKVLRDKVDEYIHSEHADDDKTQGTTDAGAQNGDDGTSNTDGDTTQGTAGDTQ